MTRLLTALGAAAIVVVVAVAARSGTGRPNGTPQSSAIAGLPTMEDLAAPAGPGSGEPNLDVGPDGRVWMSWLEPADSGHVLKVASHDGRRWSAPQTVRAGKDFFVNWADFPSVLSLGGNNLAAHWLQRSGAGTYAYGVRVAISRDGGRTWGPALRPHTDSSNTEHGFVSLWRSRSGVEAVWLDGRKYAKEGHDPSNEMSLATVSVGLEGRISSSERILDGRVCDCCQTSVATTGRGPVIVYRDRSPGEIRDIFIARREQSSGRWAEPHAVHNDGWKINACPVNGPSVAARENDVAVAWFTAANDAPTVKLAFSRDAGATFGTPVRIDEGQPAGRVDVEMLADRSALVTWIERTGGDTAAVRARRIHPDGKAGPPVTIAQSSAARASGFPRLVVRGNDAIVAWTLPGRPTQVRVARLSLRDIR